MAIQVDSELINNKKFNRTYSDRNMKIERDGELYNEAYDPAELGRVYTETDNPIEGGD